MHPHLSCYDRSERLSSELNKGLVKVTLIHFRGRKIKGQKVTQTFIIKYLSLMMRIINTVLIPVWVLETVGKID